MFPWKKKREREKSESLEELPPTTPTTPDVEQETCVSPTTPVPQKRPTEAKEKTLGVGMHAHGTRVVSPRLHRRLHSPNSAASIGYHTEESFSSLSEAHRPRGGSSASSASAASSYHTALASPSPSLLVASGSVGEMETVLSSMKEDLLQSMRALMQENMTHLEGKIDTLERKLGSRVEVVERQMQQVQSEMQHSQAAGTSAGEAGEDGESSTGLSPVREVEEEYDTRVNQVPDKSSQALQGSKKDSTAQFRRATDTEATKLARFRAVMKRKTFAQNKAQSLQDSRLPQKPCAEKVLVWLTTEVKRWKFIGRWLSIPENEISIIETQNQQEVREQCYQMFMVWKSKFPERYTYHVLGEALKRESPELFKKYVTEVHQLENEIDFPDHQ